MKLCGEKRGNPDMKVDMKKKNPRQNQEKIRKKQTKNKKQVEAQEHLICETETKDSRQLLEKCLCFQASVG